MLPLKKRKNEGFPDGSAVNNTIRLPMQETWVQSLGRDDALEEEALFLSRESHGQRSLACYRPWSRKRVRYNLATKQQK